MGSILNQIPSLTIRPNCETRTPNKTLDGDLYDAVRENPDYLGSHSASKRKRTISARKRKTIEEFDRRFDEGESIFDLAQITNVSRPNLEPQRVNVDFPKHFLVKLDCEAELRGVSRQALIKTWIYDRLTESAEKAVTREIALNALAKVAQEISDRVPEPSGQMAKAVRKSLRD